MDIKLKKILGYFLCCRLSLHSALLNHVSKDVSTVSSSDNYDPYEINKQERNYLVPSANLIWKILLSLAVQSKLAFLYSKITKREIIENKVHAIFFHPNMDDLACINDGLTVIMSVKGLVRRALDN